MPFFLTQNRYHFFDTQCTLRVAFDSPVNRYSSLKQC